MMYICTYVSVMLRNVAVTSRRNVANQRSYVIIIARKESGAWERIIINAPQAIDRSEDLWRQISVKITPTASSL